MNDDIRVSRIGAIVLYPGDELLARLNREKNRREALVGVPLRRSALLRTLLKEALDVLEKKYP